MARAMIFDIPDVQTSNPPNLTWRIEVIFAGSDVGGGSHREELFFDTANTVTPAQLATAAVSAVQSRATALGFTVAAGATLLPSYTTQ